MQWYYADNSGQQVVFQDGEFPQLVASGKIEASTLVWNANMTDWQKASLVKPEHFAGAVGSPAPATPSPTAASPYLTTSPGGAVPMGQGQSGSVSMVQTDPTSGLQTASMVCGILSPLCLGPITGIPAVICGHMARSKKKALTGSKDGTGMALAGLILGYLSIVFTILYIIWIVFMGVTGRFDSV